MAAQDAFSDDPGFELLPADDEDLTVEQELEAAELAVLEDPYATAEAEVTPLPMGSTWAFDYERGRYHMQGTAPRPVRGEAALVEWIAAALHTEYGAHPVLPDFGIEDAAGFVGEADPSEWLADFEERLTDALTRHDRIQGVDDVEVEPDPEEGILNITRLTIVTDQDEHLALPELRITPEA